MEIREIPNFPGFTISEAGEVYSPDNKLLNIKINSNDYKVVSIGKYVMGRTLVHILVALAFIGPPPNDQDKYIVNHFDGNCLNNHYTNLEWITVGQNTIHASLTNSPDNRRLLITVAGEQKLVSLNEAIADLKISDREVWELVKTNEIIYSPKRKRKERKNNSSSGQFAYGVKLPKGFHDKKKIWIKDLYTEEVIEYESTSAAGRAHNVPPNNINVMITRAAGPLRVFKKKYLLSTTDQFPEVDLKALEKDPRLHAQGRAILAYNLKEKYWAASHSGTAFCATVGLPRANTMEWFKKDVIRPKDNWIFLYYSEENKQRLLAYVKEHFGYLPESPK